MTNIILKLLLIVGCVAFFGTENAFAQVNAGAIDKAKAEKALKKAEMEHFIKGRRESFNDYKEKRRKQFEEYRYKRNKEFAEFIRSRWERFESRPGIPKPKDEKVPPVIYDDVNPTPIVPTPLPFDKVTITAPDPQPLPIEPIMEAPIDETPIEESPLEDQPIKKPILPDVPKQEFKFLGSTFSVRVDKSKIFHLDKINENEIADTWLELSEPTYTNLIYDCLDIRERGHLCDWAYLQMLKRMAEAVCGAGTDEATLLMAYVYCQSGYKMRMAKADGRLQMLYASKYTIYDTKYCTIDGEYFYSLGKSSGYSICNVKFPKEQSLSTQIGETMKLAWTATEGRVLQSRRYPDMKVNVVCNKNLIDFYSTYPSSEVNNDFMTRWAMYANTPMEERIKQEVYPQLWAHIANMSEQESVERLLNWVQTAFEYEYDTKVWGYDRAFFSEETLFYPYADCEDRSILLSRLVRDLLGLKCILVYYPGHLAAAVNFREDVKGDYISLGSDRYVICDPTYINAGVGRTMPGMNNTEAKVIVLR